MGFINWIKEFFGLNNQDETESDDILQGYETEAPREKRPKQNEDTAAKKDNKIVNINATTQVEVVLVKPEAYADGSIVADHLINRRTSTNY